MRETKYTRRFAQRLFVALLGVMFIALWSAEPSLAKHRHSAKSATAAHEASNASSSASSTSKKKSHSRRSRRKAGPPPVIEGGDGLSLNVKSALLMNLGTGKVYFSQNPDERIPPASITKVITLFLVRDALAQGRIKPDTLIPVSSQATHTGGSTMTLYKGEKVPLSEIIKGISVVSANNACVAVAEYLGKGDPSRFVAQMNAKAKSLGMSRTTFRNPNGLPASGQYSSARDIAQLSAAYLRRYPESLAIHSMTSHTYHGATHRNANSLLGRYDGADGLKTGFVCESGFNITATAKRGDTRLIAVVMGAQNPIVREVETERLLDYGFAQAATDVSGPQKSKRRVASRR